MILNIFKDIVLVIGKLIFSTHHQRYTKDLQDLLVENYQTLNIPQSNYSTFRNNTSSKNYKFGSLHLIEDSINV